jgi:crotonobetainyl-CoA:carnitine CoA-transferase CaiB-like acyl-CoA transferase
MWMLSEDVARAANAPAPGWGSFAARNVYQCADGRYVTVAANEPRTWAALCEGLGVPELAGHRIGVDDDAPVSARLREVFAGRPAAEWAAAPGLKAGIGPVNGAADLLDDPQVAARHSVVTLAGSDTRVLANPIRFHSEPGEDASHALSQPPALGEHTADVLATVGFSAAEIEALQAEKVVG